MITVHQPDTTHPELDRFDIPFGSPEVDLAPVSPPAWSGAIPPGIDDMTPGPELAAWLSVVDPSTLSGHDRVSLLRAHQRLVSHFTARMYRDMAAVSEVLQAGEHTEDLLNAALAAEAEIRTALSWSRRRTENELSFALDLQTRNPGLLEALEAGHIDVARAKAIDAGTGHLPRDTADSICSTLLREAGDLTVGQIRARVRSLAMSAEPDEARTRFEVAHERRRVVMEPATDGTAHVLAMDLAPDAAAAVARRISRLARHAKTSGDLRTPDQVRADVFVDLLLGRSVEQTDAASPGGIPHRVADIEVRVDLTTLMELDQRPAEVSGYGPVISDIARRLAAAPNSRWRFAVNDPAIGRTIASGTIRRRPTAAQRRTVRSLQPTCIFPGCRAPAVDCDLDHTVPWASGGATSEANLAPLCRHDHRIKGEAGWTYTQTPTGDVIWQSRLGHRYVRSRPPP